MCSTLALYIVRAISAAIVYSLVLYSRRCLCAEKKGHDDQETLEDDQDNYDVGDDDDDYDYDDDDDYYDEYDDEYDEF